MQITFREYQKEDFGALEKIIRKTWHYDDLCSPETAQKLARVFLSSCLTNYTFSCVALSEGIPVGIILVNNKAKHKCPLGLRMQQIKALTALFLSKERVITRMRYRISCRTCFICCGFLLPW